LLYNGVVAMLGKLGHGEEAAIETRYVHDVG
jgi:hypothetical protein